MLSRLEKWRKQEDCKKREYKLLGSVRVEAQQLKDHDVKSFFLFGSLVVSKS